MLAFFRKLRKSLIETGSARKYLLYAIGEIVLVVIGILIAIQINTLNQDRQNNKLAKEYLSRIYNDLQRDLREIGLARRNVSLNLLLSEHALIQLAADTSMLDRNDRYKMAKELFSISNRKITNEKTGKHLSNLNSFGKVLDLLTRYYSFVPTQTSYDDLSTSGKIDIIKNLELKSQIQYHYSRINSGLDFEEIYFYPYREQYLSVLSDIPIATNSKQNLGEVKELVGDSKHLVVGIQNLFEANLKMVGVMNRRQQLITDLADKINESLQTE